jgi:hypothetical protein
VIDGLGGGHGRNGGCFFREPSWPNHGFGMAWKPERGVLGVGRMKV